MRIYNNNWLFKMANKTSKPLELDESRCNHVYSEGWINKKVWHCKHPKGHRGWHGCGNKSWNKVGVLKPIISVPKPKQVA